MKAKQIPKNELLLRWRLLKQYAASLLVALVFISVLIIPIRSIQQNSIVLTSTGSILYNLEHFTWLHTEGKYIKNELNEAILLKGVCLYEVPIYGDQLRLSHDISYRIQILKELGINHVRLPINKEKWDNNLDTNGDGIGTRDFYYQLIDELTQNEIYVFVGLHYGINSTEEPSWANDPQILIDWYNNNIIQKYKTNVGVNIYIWNEPHYYLWGGTDLGLGITSGYWNAMKEITQALHAENPNMLMIVHADNFNRKGLSPILITDPIPTPNVIYTWHYYYSYEPAFNPYNPFMSGIEDPSYEYLKNEGLSYYQSYAAGNFSIAKVQFENSLYDKFFWVPNELNLPIINDEFGFSGDEIPYFSWRACDICGWNGTVNKTFDENGDPTIPPYNGVTYCPHGHAIPQPQPFAEPGWPQVMQDFINIIEKYDTSWNYFALWPKTYSGYGATLHDMNSLSVTGNVLQDCLNNPFQD